MLPPSETKSVGGDGPPLDLGALRFPDLGPQRTTVIGALTALCADPAQARRSLGVGRGKDAEIAATAALWRTPTVPALQRYTGVLYDALDAGRLPRAARARAAERLLITSALFGVVGAADPVPAYRFSAGSSIPGLPRPAAFWRPHLSARLAALGGPVVDLRSSAYAAFAPLPAAITVRVLTEDDAGGRTVVSHFNKATKGRLARALLTSRADITGVAAVARVAVRAGLRAERTGERALDVIG